MHSTSSINNVFDLTSISSSSSLWFWMRLFSETWDWWRQFCSSLIDLCSSLTSSIKRYCTGSRHNSMLGRWVRSSRRVSESFNGHSFASMLISSLAMFSSISRICPKIWSKKQKCFFNFVSEISANRSHSNNPMLTYMHKHFIGYTDILTPVDIVVDLNIFKPLGIVGNPDILTHLIKIGYPNTFACLRTVGYPDILAHMRKVGYSKILTSLGTVIYPNILTLFTNPSARAGYDTRSIFKQSLTGLNSEFSFS